MEDSGRNGRQWEVTGMWDSNICLALRHYLSPLFSSVTQLCLTLQPHGLHAACQASLSITNSQSLLKFMSIKLVIPSSHLILSSPFLPAFSLDQHQGLFQ